MQKLHEILKLVNCRSDIGLEIETEGEDLVYMDTNTWKTVEDGSLRGHFPNQCAEYVLQKPIRRSKVEAALDELIQGQVGAKFNFSFRCSVHVHINVCNMTEDEFFAFLYLAILVEEPLMNLCGDDRKGNRFCLRMSDADAYVNKLSTVFNEGVRYLRNISDNDIRYAAINVASVQKYGSLEFRGMRGTVDKDVLLPWINTLHHIKLLAIKLGNPLAVHDMFTEMGNEQFTKKVLGKYHPHFRINECEEAIDRSFSLSIDLPHRFKDMRTRPAPLPRKAIKIHVPNGPRIDYDGDPFAMRGADLENYVVQANHVFNVVFDEQIGAFRAGPRVAIP